MKYDSSKYNFGTSYQDRLLTFPVNSVVFIEQIKDFTVNNLYKVRKQKTCKKANKN